MSGHTPIAPDLKCCRKPGRSKKVAANNRKMLAARSGHQRFTAMQRDRGKSRPIFFSESGPRRESMACLRFERPTHDGHPQ
jgi:hypothetical protein